MKILVISGTYPPLKCGVGDYTNVLVSSLSRKVEDITVITSYKVPSYNNGNIYVEGIVERWSGCNLLRQILQVIRNKNFDVINIQYPTIEYNRSIINYLLPLVLRMCRKRVIFTMHEYSDCGLLYKICRIPAILFSNKIVIVDEKIKCDLIKSYSLFKKKFELINIGPNVPVSNISNEQRSLLRRMIVGDTDRKIVSYFGFITKNKCLELILEAMKRLKDRNELNIIFVIISEFDLEEQHDDYKKMIAKIIKEYGLEKDIFITGYVDSENVGDYFQISDAALLLFKNGLSMRNGSFLAAQQEGIKTITSISEDGLKYQSKMPNVTLIENNVDSVCNELLVIQNNENTRVSQGSIFDWDSISDEYIRLFEEVTC